MESRPKYTVADKQQYAKNYLKSNLSREDFCRNNKLSLASLHRWVKKYVHNSNFVPINVTSTLKNNSSDNKNININIKLKNGIIIEYQEKQNNQLINLIKSLQEL